MIGIEEADGRVLAIYCQYDGYPEHVGAMLFGHYSTEEKLRELLALGDLSTLHETQKMCCAYGRDRGERNTEADEFPNADIYLSEARELRGASYAYLWRNRSWFFSPLYGERGLRPLTAEVAGVSDAGVELRAATGSPEGFHADGDS